MVVEGAQRIFATIRDAVVITIFVVYFLKSQTPLPSTDKGINEPDIAVKSGHFFYYSVSLISYSKPKCNILIICNKIIRFV